MNHIVKSYDRDLEEVLGEVTAMGRLVREQLVKAADALEKLDADEDRSVMTRDAEVNGYEVSVDAKIESVFARRQPAARDLRTLIGMSRVSVDFERMGDEIRNMAGSVLELKGLDDSLLENRSAIIMAVNTVAHMIDDSILALSRLDTNLAREVIARDRLDAQEPDRAHDAGSVLHRGRHRAHLDRPLARTNGRPREERLRGRHLH